MLVLLDLSAAFDNTIDHDHSFCILDKYVGIWGNTHFYNRTQRVQIDISFICKQPLEAISKVNSCLSDIRRWILTNKLKINDSKTEFIVFGSLQLRCGLSGLSVNVGECQITQSLKMRDLGVIFDPFLNFDDHITAIGRSTYFHIRNIGKIRNVVSYNACSTIIQALISCRLDYCNSLCTKVIACKEFIINVHVS